MVEVVEVVGVVVDVVDGCDVVMVLLWWIVGWRWVWLWLWWQLLVVFGGGGSC